MKFVLLACLAVVEFASGEPIKFPKHLCGRQLAEARLLVCFGPEGGRRSFWDRIGKDHTNEIEWPRASRRGALSASWSRYKRDGGIADECCLNLCTEEILLQYCG